MDGACFLNPWRHKDIARLWRECFGDEQEYIDLFVDRHIDTARCAVYFVSGRPQAMLFLLDAPLRLNGDIYKASYVYAACTAINYRSNGLMGSLLDFACNGSNADFVCLVPSQESLFGYYRKKGFVTAFSKSVVTVRADELVRFIPSSSEASGSLSACRSACMGDGLLWNDADIIYALDENVFCGGKSITANDVKDYGYAVACIEGNRVIVKETMADKNAALQIAKSLSASGYDEFTLNLPYCGKGDRVETGMLRAVSAKAKQAEISGDAYLGLTLG